jgi:ABC-2 type transport system ATP-binding protein
MLSITADKITKVFARGKVRAVDSVSLKVKKGELFGLLGSNGAGKTTLIRILCTLLRPTSGKAIVLGHDVVEEADEVRKHIGLVSDKMIMYNKLTAYENLKLYGKLYDIPNEKLENRIKELLDLVRLWDKKDVQIGTFSTGMKQRINIIRGLIHEPEILFLDEPTLGLDPQSAIEIRDFVEKIHRGGTTVVLTTHYMEEAESLCERIGIMDQGKIVALDTPRGLKRMVSKENALALTAYLPEINGGLIEGIRSIPGVKEVKREAETRVHIHVSGEDSFNKVIALVQSKKGKIISVKTIEPTMEDVFLHLARQRVKSGELGEEKLGS